MSRACALAAALALALPGAAAADVLPVSVQFDAYSPAQADVLPGTTIQWQNVSERNHTVTFDDQPFGSGVLAPGDGYTQEFDTAGTFPYRCTLHPSMTGEVDVTPVLLDPLPGQAVPVGEPVVFSGRTATPARPVQVQRVTTGGAFETIATATPADDGTWKVSVPAEESGEYRAGDATGASRSRQLLVSSRKVLVRPTRAGVSVEVTPPAPYARIALQLDLRDRFGWWPARQGRLDYVSRASFRVPRGVRARVVLLAPDGWTPLATSRVLTSRAR